MPSRSPSARTDVDRDSLRPLELLGGDRGRVDVHPADAEADSRRPQPVRERQQRRLAPARDHDPVHLDSLDERLDHRFVRRRLRRALPRGRARPPLRSPRGRPPAGRRSRRASSTAGSPGASRAHAAMSSCDANRSERRLRDIGSLRGRRASRACASSGARCRFRFQAARVSPPRRRRPAPRGRPRRSRPRPHRCWRATSVTAATSVKSTTVGDVGRSQARRLGVPVDRDDAQSLRACVLDRAALVAPGADEEDRLHGCRC